MIANAYHHSILKKPINVNYSALTEKIETNHIASKFKSVITERFIKESESELLSIRIILVKVTLKIGREQYLDSWT